MYLAVPVWVVEFAKSYRSWRRGGNIHTFSAALSIPRDQSIHLVFIPTQPLTHNPFRPPLLPNLHYIRPSTFEGHLLCTSSKPKKINEIKSLYADFSVVNRPTESRPTELRKINRPTFLMPTGSTVGMSAFVLIHFFGVSKQNTVVFA